MESRLSNPAKASTKTIAVAPDVFASIAAHAVTLDLTKFEVSDRIFAWFFKLTPDAQATILSMNQLQLPATERPQLPAPETEKGGAT